MISNTPKVASAEDAEARVVGENRRVERGMSREVVSHHLWSLILSCGYSCVQNDVNTFLVLSVFL